MNRKLILALSLALSGTPLWGQDMQDSIVSQLRGQGFSEIEVNRTFLGRTRIVGSRKGQWREIILNPNTGLILRDYQTSESATSDRRDRGLFSRLFGRDNAEGDGEGIDGGSPGDDSQNGSGDDGSGDDSSGDDSGGDDSGGDDSGGEDGGGEDGGGENGGGENGSGDDSSGDDGKDD